MTYKNICVISYEMCIRIHIKQVKKKKIMSSIKFNEDKLNI